MSPASHRLWRLLRAAERQVRLDAVLALAGSVLTAVPAMLVLAWLLGAAPGWMAPSPAPLLLELAAGGAALGLAAWMARRWLRGLDARRIAAAAEVRRALPPGSVRGVLELSRALPQGTSPALFRLAETRLAHELADASVTELAGLEGERARARRRRALLLFSLGSGFALLLGLVSPERSRAGWAPLLHPVTHLSPPPLPALRVEPGDAEVPRGGALSVRVTAPGRRAVTVRWRTAGDVPRERTIPVSAAAAATRIAPVDAPLRYWITAPDGAVSDTFEVTPLDPLLVSDLVLDVIYPAYLDRPAERFDSDVPPLELPAGTELRIRGRATRRLATATLVRREGAVEVELATTADRFGGRWTPRAGGIYDWKLTSQAGESLAAPRAPLELSLVPDLTPNVEITFPGTDTTLSPDLKQAIVADASDDHALSLATLVSWRVSTLGDREPPVEAPLPLEGEPDRALLRAVLDASTRRVLPGDTLYYFVRVVDDSPARQSAVSRTYKLRFPSMSELRQQAREHAESLVREASALARSAKQLRETTRDLQRRSGGAGERSGDPSMHGGQQPGAVPRRGDPPRASQLDYREAEQARQVLERHEDMLRKVEELRDRTEQLERAMEAAGLRDPELQQRLDELRALYDQILTPELREKLAQMRQALAELDPEKVRAALEQLAQQQEEFRQRVEQSLELLRRAAVEQQMSALAREARELAVQQEAVAEAMKREGAPSPERIEQQQQLSERSQALQQALEQLEKQLAEQGETQAAEQTAQAAEQLQQAAQQTQEALRQAQQQQGEKAGEAGEAAARQMEQAAQTLDSARAAMTEAWRQEVRETVQQATNEALSLAQRQNSLMQRMQQAQQQHNGASAAEMQGMKSEQAALQQGLEALGRNLSEAGQRSAMVNRDVGAALGRAMLSMQQTLNALEGKDGARRMPVQEAQQSVDALNRLALELLRNGQQIEQAQTGTGLQEALARLAELAQRQGALNGQASSLLPLDLAPQVLSLQLQQLAQQQVEIARQLSGLNDRLGGREDVLGRLDELAREADQLARDLSGGRLSPELLARQERLFHRLLDAGRTLERDEVTDERVSERPGEIAPSRAGALDPRLLDHGLRFPVPRPEELRELPPAYRRLILEYFQRLNRAAQQGESEGQR